MCDVRQWTTDESRVGGRVAEGRSWNMCMMQGWGWPVEQQRGQAVLDDLSRGVSPWKVSKAWQGDRGSRKIESVNI